MGPSPPESSITEDTPAAAPAGDTLGGQNLTTSTSTPTSALDVGVDHVSPFPNINETAALLVASPTESNSATLGTHRAETMAADVGAEFKNGRIRKVRTYGSQKRPVESPGHSAGQMGDRVQSEEPATLSNHLNHPSQGGEKGKQTQAAAKQQITRRENEAGMSEKKEKGRGKKGQQRRTENQEDEDMEDEESQDKDNANDDEGGAGNDDDEEDESYHPETGESGSSEDKLPSRINLTPLQYTEAQYLLNYGEPFDDDENDLLVELMKLDKTDLTKSFTLQQPRSSPLQSSPLPVPPKKQGAHRDKSNAKQPSLKKQGTKQVKDVAGGRQAAVKQKQQQVKKGKRVPVKDRLLEEESSGEVVSATEAKPKLKRKAETVGDSDTDGDTDSESSDSGSDSDKSDRKSTSPCFQLVILLTTKPREHQSLVGQHE